MEAIENKWLKIVSEVEKEKKDCFFKRKSLKEEGFEAHMMYGEDGYNLCVVNVVDGKEVVEIVGQYDTYAIKDTVKKIRTAYVREIGGFGGCNNLVEVEIDDDLTCISSEAFIECEKLKEVIMPDSVETIEMCAFSGCKKLKKVILSNNLDSIGSAAFSGCSSLESIIIPESVSSIEDEAFMECDKLKYVIILDGDCDLGEEVFAASNPIIVAPSGGSVEEYASDYDLEFESLD